MDRFRIVPLPTLMLPVNLNTFLAVTTFLNVFQTKQEWEYGPLPTDANVIEGMWFPLSPKLDVSLGKRGLLFELSPCCCQWRFVLIDSSRDGR